jgi:tripartite-type tricarboxylate transporter receptor subunit TctC
MPFHARRAVPLLCATAAFSLSMQALAQGTYPNRPIRVIVPFGTGSVTDVIARVTMPALSEALGQPILVDNRPGGGGNPGTDLGVKAAPDGHTLILSSASTLAVNGFLFSNMPYDMATAFAPITQINAVTNVLVVSPALPVKSVPELIAHAKANPGKLSYGSAGAGGTIHLAAEMFKALTGTQMEHIVYKASPIAHIDLFSGQIQLMFDGLPPSIGHIKAGRLRALAVTPTKRSALLPDLPTMAEAGVPGYNVQGWNGFVGPAGLPRAIVERLNRETVLVLRREAVRQRLLELGAEPVGNTPEEFGAHLRAERELWGKLIRRIGLKLD